MSGERDDKPRLPLQEVGEVSRSERRVAVPICSLANRFVTSASESIRCPKDQGPRAKDERTAAARFTSAYRALTAGSRRRRSRKRIWFRQAKIPWGTRWR